MFKKLKDLIVGNVIMKKVGHKFAKHLTLTLAAFLAAKPWLTDAGVTIDYSKLETYAGVLLSGFLGAAWQCVEYRFVKPDAKPPVEVK